MDRRDAGPPKERTGPAPACTYSPAFNSDRDLGGHGPVPVIRDGLLCRRGGVGPGCSKETDHQSIPRAVGPGPRAAGLHSYRQVVLFDGFGGLGGLDLGGEPFPCDLRSKSSRGPCQTTMTTNVVDDENEYGSPVDQLSVVGAPKQKSGQARPRRGPAMLAPRKMCRRDSSQRERGDLSPSGTPSEPEGISRVVCLDLWC